MSGKPADRSPMLEDLEEARALKSLLKHWIPGASKMQEKNNEDNFKP